MARKVKVEVRPVSKVAGKANRWQYETISISRMTEIVALNAMLNGLGEQGYELVPLASMPQSLQAPRLIRKEKRC